jgi:thioredoxin reductase (NADPH)
MCTTTLGQKIWDCIIIGSGAAGMSAAINAASEGLSILVVDRNDKTGGLIGTTSLIENYPGFPDGIEGRVLTDNMETQARKFGTEFLMNADVLGIDKQEDLFTLMVEQYEPNWRGKPFVYTTIEHHYSKCIIMAAGRIHKKLGLENEAQLVHDGVLRYGHPDTTHNISGHVCIIGGGNSAGQAATWLTSHACKVTLVAPHFNHMSQYLIDRIHTNPALEVVMGKVTEIKDQTNGVARVWVNKENGIAVFGCDRVYSLIGLEVEDTFSELKNENGFLTNCTPGIFVAGDCRDQSEKRCTAAVGEGVMAVSRVHQYLKDLKTCE